RPGDLDRRTNHMDFLDERLRRKLIKRRGRLHAFERLVAAKTAIVVIDLTQSFLHNVPGGAALVGPVDRLTTTALRRRARGLDRAAPALAMEVCSASEAAVRRRLHATPGSGAGRRSQAGAAVAGRGRRLAYRQDRLQRVFSRQQRTAPATG